MSKLTIKMAPADTPISLANVKAHLRWDDADGSDTYDSDAQLTQMISDAVDIAEGETWSRFFTQTWDQYFDAFADPLYLSYPPTASISSVKYQDADNAEQDLSEDIYELGEENGIGIVRRKYNQDWPITLSHPDSVVVQFICGYGVAAAVPDGITAALKLIVAHLATHRGDRDEPLPNAVRALLSQYSFRTVA